MAKTKKLSLGSNPVQTVLLVLLVVASFAIGSLYTKVKYLEGGSSAPAGQEAALPSKYESFEEAMRAMANIAGADEDRLITCMNSGEKKAVVDADTTQGDTAGVTGTPAFFINGRLLAGAYPFEEFKTVIDEELAGTADATVVRIPVELGNASAVGPANAPVTIIEFSDFQCPFCGRSFPTVKQILDEYGDDVRFAYKHYPLISIHPRAQKTAEASECARDQGKFWEFHDALFENQVDWESL
jgi:protein-disulfide isomerase